MASLSSSSSSNHPPNSTMENNNTTPASYYRVRVTRRFLIWSLLSCIFLAFCIGRTARMVLIVTPQRRFVSLLEHQAQQQQQQVKKAAAILTNSHPNPNVVMNLPNPVLKAGKQAPPNTYTSKMFDTTRSATINSRWVVTTNEPPQQQQCTAEEGSSEQGQGQVCQTPTTTTASTRTTESDDNEDENDEEELHLPAGQHLLMDIQNVDASFLASEERLANAMLEVVENCGLTLLSYHCHGLEPSGVSCVGVLLESHVSFHTWPMEGVITLDLFTCGPGSLLPIVSTVERLFSVPITIPISILAADGAGSSPPPPETVWAYKLRGFGGDDNQETTAELTDLFTFPIGTMTDYKKEIASVKIGSERVDIYDVLRPKFQSFDSYKASLRKEDGSYESRNPTFFQPDRIVYVNGVLQTRRSGDASYHESLVHPAMFAHEYPARVAIIGGADGAILREVLKHKTVKKVVMIEDDERLLNLTNEHFPEYTDCSFLTGGTKSCLDDPRVEIYYEDVHEYFGDEESDHTTTEPFDVIIMDEVDYVGGPEDGVDFLKFLPDWLSTQGVFVAAAGEAPALDSPPEEYSKQQFKDRFVDALVDIGFESVRDYEESHGGYELPWQFILAFKSFDTRVDWFSNEASVNLEIRKRATPTTSGGSPFLFFDGATQQSVMYPSRASETVFCRQEETPEKCEGGHGFDPEWPNLSIAFALEVKESSIGEFDGRGLFAKNDIPAPSYVGLDQLVHPLYFYPSCYEVLDEMAQHWAFKRNLGKTRLLHNAHYGHIFSHHGGLESYVNSSIQCFVNHGCNGSSNFGHDLEVSEADADPDSVADEVLRQYEDEEFVYNPAVERQSHFYAAGSPLRPVTQGEEILLNYLALEGRYEWAWKSAVIDLQGMCSKAKK